ncbi:aldehyde dehydrogenase family protein [Sinorhizobium meliloti]|uniref:aldehyde dehydrogenase family protein n=1 Tax=Rhizobium meliloti TaxID=382 RepID=UPI0018E78BE4|nr:aldehyde dehydrogenase family protein [Sinorhizobium meliloti]QQF06181.1 aldehyde dehydrogenase family protein [Sinorhizobium meliloti]
MKHYGRFYIDGEWVEATGSRTFELVDPTSESPFATIALGRAEDVDRAVAAARRALPAFSSTSKNERVELFENIINVYSSRSAELAAAVAEEMGSPISSTVQVSGALAHFKQAIVTLRDYEFERRIENSIVRREPIGVCGLISPWNWPIQTPATKVAYALAAGCTVVLKPSEYSPTSALMLAEILHEAGVPKGAFNLINGDGPVVGTALCKHPDVDFVSFTGSTRAGILVAEAAAPTVKRVAQELGGKSANIILPDADIAAAARWNVERGMFNAGQSCHSPSRILVQIGHLEQLLDHIRVEAAKIRIGDPRSGETTMGPVVNKAQFERIQRYIQTGIDEGARLVCGGVGRPENIERGYFVRPTVFADVTPDMTIAREEIFGPVLSVISYDTEEDAVRIANGTPYGLGGYLFTSSPEKAWSVGRQMQAGRIFLNGAAGTPAAPMGGYKQSGNGREMGIFGLEEYLEIKAMFGFSELAA